MILPAIERVRRAQGEVTRITALMSRVFGKKARDVTIKKAAPGGQV
jgi:hypothetical protein